MAFRRSARSRGRSFRPRSRGPKLHTPRDSGRWEQGRFFLQFEFNVDEANQQQVLFVHLASNRFSIGGDNTQSFPRTMANMARNFEVGGIVFDWGIAKLTNSFLRGGTTTRDLCYWETSVLTDRLDAAGSPASLTNNAPLISTPPVTLSTATLADQAETELPTRIHWRRTEMVDSTVTFLNTNVAEGGNISNGAYGQQIVRDQRRTESLRLKLRLDDEQGLFFRVAIRTAQQFPESDHGFLWWAAGSIYYRVRF